MFRLFLSILTSFPPPPPPLVPPFSLFLTQRLTSIQSPYVEVYLTKQGDEELLLNHLHQSGRFAQAIETAHAYASASSSSQAASPQALPPGKLRPLDERPSIGFALPHGVLTRMQCLDLALRSARAAMESQQQGGIAGVGGSFEASVSELLEQKQRATWQQNLLTKLELRQDPGDWVTTTMSGNSGSFDARRDWLPTGQQLHALR